MTRSTPSELDPLDGLLERAFGRGEPSEDARLQELVGERFEVLAPLGAGGMGSVWSARDRKLERLVALKFVRPELWERAEARARFLREGRLLSRFNHPNICKLFDYLTGDVADVLVLELVEGRSLAELLGAAEGGALDRRQRIGLWLGIARALEAAHRAGVVHRDLKPANVVVTPGGVAKVLDFGIARSHGGAVVARQAMDSGRDPGAVGRTPSSAPGEPARDAAGRGADEGGFATQSGRLLGTPQYMSPEQRRGEPASAASDVHAFGRILQEMRPLPRVVERLAGRMTAGDATERPSSVEVLRILERYSSAARRRVLIGTFGLGLLVLGWLSFRYVTDLGAERDLVVARQAQSERLIDFVVGDVASRLEAVGPQDLIEELDRQSLAYFRAVDGGELSDEELRHWVQATLGVGERTRVGERLDTAREVFAQARRFLEERLAREPGDPEWRFELGQVAFYQGQLERDAGDMAAARGHWELYAEISRELADAAPDDVLFQDERAYAETNLGVLALERASRGEPAYEAALEHFEAALAHWLARAAADPDDEALAVEVADVRSWMGSLHLASGDFAAAERIAADVLAARLAALDADPGSRVLQHAVALGRMHLGNAHMLNGEVDAARDELRAALADCTALLDVAPDQTEWRRTWLLSAHGLALAELLALDLEAANAHARSSAEALRELIERDPDNEDWRSLATGAYGLHLELRPEPLGDGPWMSDLWGSVGGEGRNRAYALLLLELLRMAPKVALDDFLRDAGGASAMARWGAERAALVLLVRMHRQEEALAFLQSCEEFRPQGEWLDALADRFEELRDA